MSRSFPAFVLGVSVLALDQVTKQVAAQSLEVGRNVEIIPGFFYLTQVRNTGAAWGVFREHGFWLAMLAGGALLFLTAYRRHFTGLGTVSRIALGFLLGGIAGNLADRIIRGHVIDFLGFYLGSYAWPAFNVADSAICVGVALYLWDSFRQVKAPGSAEEKPSTGGTRGSDGTPPV